MDTRPTLEKQLDEYRREWHRLLFWRRPTGRVRIACDLIGIWLALPVFLAIIDRFVWWEAIIGATVIVGVALLIADILRTWNGR